MRSLDSLVEEAQRALRICNACRYCEGFCAVFPALERRLDFTADDVHYLANLCHNCGSCLYACQYAPPHEFQLNFPRLMAQARVQAWRRYAWPAFLGRLYERNGIAVALTSAICLFLLLYVSIVAKGDAFFEAHPDSAGSFYALIPHHVMAGTFGAVFLAALAAMAVSLRRFWRAGAQAVPASRPLGEALRDALRLKNLDGGGGGCPDTHARPSNARRAFHHLTFYGFLLCFAATCVATAYHYAFGWKAPYPFWSVPVLLGTVGGIGLLAGPAGLFWLRARRDPDLADPAQAGMDAGFLALLFLVSLTGLGLLALRETQAMGVLLALHLGAVLAFFLLLPYGKFMHGLYRTAALARFHVERRQPGPGLGAE